MPRTLVPHLSRRSMLQLGLQAGGAALAAPFVLRAATTPARAEAPMLGTARPAFNRFKLGAFEITTVFDGGVAMDGPHPIFGQDQTAEAVEALAAENHLPAKRMEIGFTPVIVNTGKELVVFDTGNGAGRRPAAGNFAAALKAAGYQPEQVDTVVITHMHPDHIGGIMEKRRAALRQEEPPSRGDSPYPRSSVARRGPASHRGRGLRGGAGQARRTDRRPGT